MIIAPELQDQVVAHARRDAPNECCGIVALRDGAAYAVHALPNAQASPLRFEIDGLHLVKLLPSIEDEGGSYAIYHSHTRSAPYPSQTDIEFSLDWPGIEWLIVGLAGKEPELRSFQIDERGAVSEAGVG